MEYTYHYMNKHIERTYASFTLMIYGIVDEEIVEQYRIEKTFTKNFTDETLRLSAEKEIEMIIIEKEIAVAEAAASVII